MIPENFKDELSRAIQRAAEGIWAAMKLAQHPVGSLFISLEQTSPATLFGGVWEQLDNYTIAAESAAHPAGTTEGDGTHTLSVDEMPAHAHSGPSHTHTATTASGGGHTHTATTASGGGHTHTATTNSSGSHTHNLSILTRTGNGQTMLAVNRAHYSQNQDAIASGGAHTHTLTTNSAGGHTHTLTTNSAGGHTHTLTTAAAGTGATGSAGGGQAFSVMQPTLYAYVWRRTA